MNIGLLRLKLLLATYGQTVFWALVIAGLLSFAGAGWLYTHPPTKTITEEANPQTISSEVDTTAVVTDNTSLWGRGTKLSNQSVFPMAAPSLKLVHRTHVPENSRSTVTQKLVLVYQAARDETVFWQRERTITQTQSQTRQGLVKSSGSLEIPKIQNNLEQYNDELIGLGSVSTTVRFEVRYETDRYSGTLSKTVPLDVSANGYWVTGDFSTSESHSQLVTRTVQQDPNYALISMLGLLGFLCSGGALIHREYGPDESQLPFIKHSVQKVQFEEWISEGKLDGNIGLRVIPISSLDDLVDVAIDAQKRVIHDKKTNRYVVIDGDVVYEFVPGESPEFSWAESSSDQALASEAERGTVEVEGEEQGLEPADQKHGWDRLLE